MTMDEPVWHTRVRQFLSLCFAWLIPPIRYWVVRHNGHKQIMVIRARINPGTERSFTTVGVITLDGPFAYQEDAVRSMAFWQAQYDRRKPAARG